MTEFELIKHFFKADSSHQDVVLGVGDDAAIVKIPTGFELAITTDTLVSGIHFPIKTTPFDIAYKSLAVNLSDLASMGATPAWILLALTLPEQNKDWLREFSAGLFALANQYHVALIGGDVTHGPLSITIQALGLVPNTKAILRSGAKPGDLIYITNTVGDAGLALAFLNGKINLQKEDQIFFLNRLNRPQPQIELGKILLDYASAAIDISDGLAQDLSHILNASTVGATIYVDRIPVSTSLSKYLTQASSIELALTAGDDYELCFTIPKHLKTSFESLSISKACTNIGEIKAEPGLTLCYQNGKIYDGEQKGYQHF